jgi:hypothetical protein
LTRPERDGSAKIDHEAISVFEQCHIDRHTVHIGKNRPSGLVGPEGNPLEFEMTPGKIKVGFLGTIRHPLGEGAPSVTDDER